MSDHEVSAGEIYRSLQELKAAFREHREERAADSADLRVQLRDARNQMTTTLAPIAVLQQVVNDHTQILARVVPQVDSAKRDTAVNATFVSIGVSLIVMILGYLLRGGGAGH